MVQPFPGLFPPVYIPDCCSILTLDGKHSDGAPSPFSAEEQDRIWHRLQELCDAGRFKVPEQVKTEIGKYHPDGLKRIRAMKGHGMPPRNDTIVRAYQEVTSAHPHMVRKIGANPGDPWIVAWGRTMMARGIAILTEETRLGPGMPSDVRRRKTRYDLPLPDICDEYGLKTITLLEFVSQELPTPPGR